MSAAAYRIEEVVRLFAADGTELAIDIDDGNCIIRISRNGNRLAIAREMLKLGIELGAKGMVNAVPIVGEVGSRSREGSR